MLEDLPDGFAYLNDPRMIYEIRYATSNNFIGRPVHGYESQVCILTEEAIDALIEVQNDLDSLNKNYALLIYDGYRPTRAVRDFLDWSKIPEEPAMKEKYHPYLLKDELFEFGYIHEHSAHSRGSTVDLTIAIRDGDSYTEMEMGTIFDYFGEESHTEANDVPLEAQRHRKFLVDTMARYGFENFCQEWWHFTLEDEPFTEDYFDFPVK